MVTELAPHDPYDTSAAVGGSLATGLLEPSALASVAETPLPTGAQISLTVPVAPLCFRSLFDDYSRYVPGLLRRLGVHPADADDVAQDVFIAILRQLPGFEGRSTIKTWVCSICSKKAHDYRRTIRRRQKLLAAAAKEQAQQLESSDPRDELLRKEHELRLHRELTKLPQEQREVFVLFEIEELTMKEVAAAVGCPLDTAYTRHRVARKRVLAGFERASI